MCKRLVFILLAIYVGPAFTQVRPETQNVILVTLDGFRWQELFRGGDPGLLANPRYVKDRATIGPFEGDLPETRRQQLLPFFWNVIGSDGQLYGNRDKGNHFDCSNPYWFSYPGYSEMLVGAVDRGVCSNLKVENPNTTVLDFLTRQPGFQHSVAAFSTWDVLPFILGHSTALPVNCDESWPSQLSNDSDSVTFSRAMNFLQCYHPRVLYIALDETDHFAHADRYDLYLLAAHRADRWIAQLWDWIQSEPAYRNKTTLLITTDHGRGQNSKKSWRHHGRFTRGSGQIWMAALGPDTPADGEMTVPQQLYQKQVAKSIAALMGLNYENKFVVGEAIPGLLKPVQLMAESGMKTVANK